MKELFFFYDYGFSEWKPTALTLIICTALALYLAYRLSKLSITDKSN